MNFEILSLVTFFSLVAIMLWRDRKKVEFSYGISIRRMYRGRKALDRIVKNHKRLFTIIGDFSVAIAVITAVAGTGALIVLPLISQQSTIAVVLPTVNNYAYPGPVVSIPAWYWLIAVFVIMAVHETMHAVMSRLAGISIKNYGIMFFLVLPIGAFVDPDMKKVSELKFMQKQRIYAAGSFGNFMTALFVFILFFSSLFLVNGLIHTDGVKFAGTTEGMPAREIGLSGVIYNIDGNDVRSVADLRDVLSSKAPGDYIDIKTTEGDYRLKTIQSPYNESFAYIGIEGTANDYKYSIGQMEGDAVPDNLLTYISSWYTLLNWLFILSLGVAVINLLPMKPFDGGYIFEEFAKKFLGGRSITATKFMTMVVLTLLILNLFAFELVKNILSTIV